MLSIRLLNRLYYLMMVCFALMIVVATFIPLGKSRDISHAQETNTPTIVLFESDLESVTPDQAESGEMPTTVRWETEGMSEDDSLKLDVLVLGEWQNAVAEGTQLDPIASLDVIVPHTLDFQEPTWRLSIVDGENADNVLASQELRLAYVVHEETVPEIVSFEAGVERIDINELQQGIARVPVAWEVINRVPNSNLQFVQAYTVQNTPGTISVELPREFEWVRSTGEGILAPVNPLHVSNVSSIVLRLQVVDQDDPSILYVFEDIEIPVVGELLPTPRPSATSPSVAVPITRTPRPTEDVGPSNGESCDTDFFFEEAGREYVYSGGGTLNGQVFDLCPSGAPQTTQATFQMYENGMMIWRYSAEQSVVYVLTNDGLGAVLPSYSNGDSLVITDTPPDGITILPEGPIGAVWSNWTQHAQSVGWPVDYPQDYQMTLQETSRGEIEGIVLTLPTGGRFFVRYGIQDVRPITWAWINATN